MYLRETDGEGPKYRRSALAEVQAVSAWALNLIDDEGETKIYGEATWGFFNAYAKTFSAGTEPKANGSGPQNDE